MTDTARESVYSSSTGEYYESWEELVAAESNGWVATAILRERAKRGQLFTLTLGPYPSKREATNARQRIRVMYRKQESSDEPAMSDLVTISVRPAWKDL